MLNITSFGAWFRRSRLNKGLPQLEFAEKSGLTVESVEQIERGATAIAPLDLEKIANGLDISSTVVLEIFMDAHVLAALKKAELREGVEL